MILGWKIDSRRLLISLPADRHTSWCRDIQALLSAPLASHKLLETTIGHLNHAGFINSDHLGLHHPSRPLPSNTSDATEVCTYQRADWTIGFVTSKLILTRIRN
jgi:hypothetical protein